MKFKKLIAPLALAAILSGATTTLAAEKTIEILAPWQGSGHNLQNCSR